MLALGLGSVHLTPTLASESKIVNHGTGVDNLQLAQRVNRPLPFADGIYLYGQSPKAEQIGQEYLVFKVQQGRVIGAFYMPQSEFSCFYGNLNHQSMDLSIIDPYEQTVYPYSIALQPLTPLADGEQTSLKMGLEGYHSLAQVSDNDRRILNICLQQYR
jgi:hypothetical protein